MHACGIRTCLCGMAVWPASDSFSILSPSQGGVCVGVITDYAVSFLPLGELHILWSQRASEDLHRLCSIMNPLSPDLDECADTHVHYANSHTVHHRHIEFPGECLCRSDTCKAETHIVFH